MSDIEKIINDAWENKDQVSQNSNKSVIDSINQIIEDLDQGKVRVAEKINGAWVTHQHIKKAIMLSFRIHGMETLSGPYSSWYDKAHLIKGKTAGWAKEDFEKSGFRMVLNEGNLDTMSSKIFSVYEKTIKLNKGNRGKD